MYVEATLDEHRTGCEKRQETRFDLLRFDA